MILFALIAAQFGDGSTEQRQNTGANTLPANGAATLKSAAQARGITFGTAVNSGRLASGDSAYSSLLAQEFAMVTPETAMKWAALEPTRGQWNFAEADALMAVAQQNGQSVRGHTLVWHRSVPSWIEEGSFSREELLEILHSFIATTVGRYRGQVSQWDVVNEVVDDSGALRDSIWLDVIGPDYIDYAIRWAHEADPDAVLFLNEVGAETSAKKSNAIMKLIDRLQEANVPIDGLGYEAHQSESFDDSDEAKLRASLQDGADRGLQLALTEVDVRAELAADGSYDATKQNQVYGRLVRACADQPACKTIVVWGFTDAVSWVPDRYPGFGAATLYTADFQAKSARSAVVNALGE